MKPFAALLKRQPFSPVSPPNPILPEDLQITDPQLAARYAAANEAIAGPFAETSTLASKKQARFRRLRVGLLTTAMLTGALGALQAAWGSSFIPGLAVAVVGLIATTISRTEARERPGESYLSARAKAEELRALQFRAIGTPVGDDLAALEVEVANILHPLDAAQ
jgi:hypothetical protein